MQSRFKTTLEQSSQNQSDVESSSDHNDSQNGETSFTTEVPQAQSSNIPRPKNIGRYKVIEEIGRGAMAVVYKAYDPEIDRFLAVKVLREELATDDDYRAGFIREAKFAGQLSHPGIVTIYDVGVADDKPYIAMELLDGVPLDQLLKIKERLPLNFLIAIIVQMTRALNYAHKQGVIHRDIKPGNIICMQDNKTVKLTDFGIAQLDDSLASSGKSQDKVLGTPEYMSPEQVLGQKADARSDLYSMGVLIFAMATGYLPFRAEEYSELFKQIVKDKAPKMEVAGVNIPDELQDIVRKLLQKQPDKRYQNSAELMRDVRELIDALESVAKEQNRPGFVSLRLRWTLSMASLVAVSMLVGLVIVYYQQFMAMRGMALDYGYSTARLIAFEVAEPLLLNDDIALSAIIQDLKRTQEIEYISLRNKQNTIVASTVESEIGKPFKPFQSTELIDTSDNSFIFTRDITKEHKVFDIDSGVTFQNKAIGRVTITLSADSLVQSSKITLIIMVTLMVVTLIAVFSMTLAFARQISNQANRFSTALERVRRGQFNRRLTVERRDEFGRMSVAFNHMAEALEKRWEKRNNNLSGDTKKLRVRKPSQLEANNKNCDDSTVIIEKKSD